jgi:hypothetical protein
VKVSEKDGVLSWRDECHGLAVCVHDVLCSLFAETVYARAGPRKSIFA